METADVFRFYFRNAFSAYDKYVGSEWFIYTIPLKFLCNRCGIGLNNMICIGCDLDNIVFSGAKDNYRQ